MTHKDIAEHVGVHEATAQRWGKAGLLGPKLIDKPAHYAKTALKKAEEIEDGRFKLTDEDVRELRQRSDRESLTALAKEFGVDVSYVSLIVRNKRRIVA